jgi:hypothetical protein
MGLPIQSRRRRREPLIAATSINHDPQRVHFARTHLFVVEMEQLDMQQTGTPSESAHTASKGEAKPTFDVDLTLPGVQELLRVVAEVELELRRKRAARRMPEAS